MALRDAIAEKALELGFAAVGFAAAEPFDLYERELAERPEMYAWSRSLSTHTSVRDLDLPRTADPARVLPSARSLVVVTHSYLEEDVPEALAGRIGRVYLKGLLCPEDTAPMRRKRAFVAFLKGLGMKVVAGETPARLAAARAGLARYGKNCFGFATRGAGKSSFVLFETFLVDRELEPDRPTHELACPEDCRKCLDACPTGALYEPLRMDPRRCIARLGYFQDGPVPRELRPKMGTWVYGCDACQESCPRNAGWLRRPKPMDAALLARAGDLRLTTLLSMSQEHYERRVWPLLYYIRKEDRRLWQRNAAVALGNERDPDSAPALAAALADPEPLVRGHAAWALGRIGGRRARVSLEARRGLEPDPGVRGELAAALEGSGR